VKSKVLLDKVKINVILVYITLKMQVKNTETIIREYFNCELYVSTLCVPRLLPTRIWKRTHLNAHYLVPGFQFSCNRNCSGTYANWLRRGAY